MSPTATTLISTSSITSSPVQKKSNISTMFILIATASSAAMLAVICIVVMTIVCISLAAKRKTKSFTFPPSSTLAVEENEQVENHSKVSIHVHVQDVEEEEDIKPHFVEGTRKRRHLSPVMMTVGSKESLQFDQPPQEMSKQGSPGPGPDTTITTKSTVSEAGNAKKIRLFTITDDETLPPPTSGESVHRYDNVIIDDKPPPTTGSREGSHSACSSTSHNYNNVIIGTVDQKVHLATPTVTQTTPTVSSATPTVSRLSPIRGNRVRPVVQPYSSVTIATKFGITMERNEAYGSRENLTADADVADDEDNATKNTEDDSNDYDDIV